ncbi:MAG: hypothetical protein JXA46_07710 [Dehalococcoidales bacterium]|nr:hypothetical protein [Dehalococcoidales bacterium]
MYDAIFIEERNKPTASFVFKYFANDARSGASSHGMPLLRIVPESIVSECTVLDEIEPEITRVMDDVISVLTVPLSDEEANPRLENPGMPPRTIFRGSLQEVNRFFYRRGWTDGLPVIPPTEEAVAEMCSGAGLPPDYLVAKLEPRLGKATVEKIAVNAVMAGALPTHMPVLIAGTRALVSNRAAVMMAASTGSFSPLWIVNGPVRNDIMINCGYGAMNPGDVANASIGRAMGLITKNIRGVRKQIEDMGVLGNPGKYSWVMGENEENSPWEPLHVDRGFKAEDSAITLTFPQTYIQIMPYETDDTGILKSILYNAPPLHMGVFGVLLTPTNARALASRGWTRKSIISYIIENTRVPRERHQNFFVQSQSEREKQDSVEQVPLFRVTPADTEPVQIYVVGGFGSWMGLTSGGTISTEKIELPPDWKALVDKYRDIVPHYLMY